jgi:hypothetical protein
MKGVTLLLFLLVQFLLFHIIAEEYVVYYKNYHKEKLQQELCFDKNIFHMICPMKLANYRESSAKIKDNFN